MYQLKETSLGTFDRRGDVFFSDDFESDVLKWALGGSGFNYAYESTAIKARNGAFCCELTTDIAVGDNVRIARDLSYPRLSSLGTEFSYNQIGNISSIRLYIDLDNGVNVHQAIFRYDPPTGDVYIYDRFAGWVPLEGGLMLSTATKRFHTVKLVANFVTDRYVRLLLNNREWPLTQYSLNLGLTAVPGAFEVSIWVYNQVAGAHKAWVDDFVVTQNEP